MVELQGNINSIEPCTTTNGPGTRFAVFFQGCPMRCQYCCEPNCWDFNVNQKMTSEEILQKYEKAKEFLKNGGLSATGGEPMAQLPFLIDLFKKSKQKNIHTVLDTSGINFDNNNLSKIEELMKYTDIVLLDIKHIENDRHIALTGHPNINTLNFARYLSQKNIPVWIRQVVIPGINFNKANLTKLGEFLSTLKNIQALDILPHNNAKAQKWTELKKQYPLKDIPLLTQQQAQEAKNCVLQAMRNTLKG